MLFVNKKCVRYDLIRTVSVGGQMFYLKLLTQLNMFL